MKRVQLMLTAVSDGQKTHGHTVDGWVAKKDDKFLIKYLEPSVSGLGDIITTLLIEPQKKQVTMLRSAPYKTHMVIAEGARTQADYGSAAGTLRLGVTGHMMHLETAADANEEKFLALKLRFLLDSEGQPISKQEFLIRISDENFTDAEI